MDPPYRGYGDYEQDEHRHPPFYQGPPPPPPAGDDFGDRPFYGRRDDDFPRRHSRPDEDGFRRDDDDEGSYGRRRGDQERERFGRDGGYPPEDRPHFPQVGFGYRPSHTEGPPPEEFAPAPSDDSEYPSQHHSFTHSGSYHGQRPSAGPVAADPLPEDYETPVTDAGLTSQMDSLSLDLPQGRLVRVFCKENSAFNLAVEHNSLQMQASNTDDESQHWIKDASHGMRVKDNFGSAAFSLVNKKTRKVLKHAKEQGQQVLLVDYQPGLKDDDILWTESQDFGEGFKTIRSASDTLLNLTVFEGQKKIRNGSALMLDTWHKGDHQLWKLFPL